MNRLFFCLLIGCLFCATGLSAEQQTVVRHVTFDTADGGVVDAVIHGNGDGAVVLAHGAIFNKASWDAFSKALAETGFTALALDFRGYGRSKPGTKPDALYEDILAAVRYLRRNGATAVSVVGASMGGGAAAMAFIKAKPREIDRLILLSPVSIARPERLKGEILFVASRDEPGLGRIKAMFEKVSARKEFVLLDGRAHAQHIFKTNQSEKLELTMIRFLAEGRVSD